MVRERFIFRQIERCLSGYETIVAHINAVCVLLRYCMLVNHCYSLLISYYASTSRRKSPKNPLHHANTGPSVMFSHILHDLKDNIITINSGKVYKEKAREALLAEWENFLYSFRTQNMGSMECVPHANIKRSSKTV